MTWFFIMFVCAYLLGSVPFGLLIARMHGVDIQKVGSGNIGATNVVRNLGKKWGILCFFLDCLKGLVPMLVAGMFVEDVSVASLSMWLGVGCAAILGHVFPVFLKFKGGKGISTSMGVMLGLYPYLTIPGVFTFVVWVVVLFVFRYVSLASVLAAVAFPILLTGAIVVMDGWEFGELWPLLVVASVLAGLIVIRHVGNIKRIMAGSESKAFQGKQGA